MRPEPLPSASPGENAAPAGRIATLDILRGLALLGMVIAHVHKTLATDPSSVPVGWGITHFVAEKDRTIFAFLFGCSFAIMMRGIEARGLAVVPVFLRRLLVLYGIGVVVEALTQFSILRDYAWWGLPLLAVRKLPTRTLLVLAALSAAAFTIRDAVDSAAVIVRHGRTEAVARETARLQAWERSTAAQRAALGGNVYAEVVTARVRGMADRFLTVANFTPSLYLALFLLGLLAVRHGIFADPARHRRLLLAAAAAGLAVWIVAWWGLPRLPVDFPTPGLATRLRAGGGILDEQFLAFTYIGTLTLLLAHDPRWQRRLSALAWVGRMALTNYLLHAAVIDFASAPYGLHLRIPPWAELPVAAVIFGGLFVFSRIWLARCRYGPVEWAWRSLTYWRRVPLKTRSAAALAG